MAAPDTLSLRIGATATNARKYVAPYLSEWIPSHPGVRMLAISGTDAKLRSRLENGDCDATILSVRPQGRFERIHLETVHVRAVLPNTHPLATTTEPLRVLDLAEEPLLVNGPGYPSHDLLLRAYEVAGIQPRIAFECSVGMTLAAAAEAGMGVAVFGQTTSTEGMSVVSRPLLQAGGDPLTFDLFVTWPTGAPRFTADFCVGLATFHRTHPTTD